MRPTTLVVACIFALTTAAHAQDAATAQNDQNDTSVFLNDTRDAWTVRIDPSVWWVSPSGKIKLPSSGVGVSDKVRVEDLNLDTPRLTPAGSIALNVDHWRFAFFGAGYTHDTNTTSDDTFRLGDVVATPGDPLSAKFDFSLFEVEAGYRFYRYDFKVKSQDKEEAADSFVDFLAVFGGRFYDMDISVGGPAAGGGGTTTSKTEQFFAEPIIGARAELHVIHDFLINVQLSGGGFGDSDRTSYSFDIALSFEWNPIQNVGVQIGWRQVLYSFEDGSGNNQFQYDGAMAGLFGGVVIRF